MKQYDYIRFSQYGSATDKDDLLLFAAKAKDIYSWAGIPRKGWHIRMLFQRPITDSREADLKRFWTKAAQPDDGTDFIVGPTAIIVAIQDGQFLNGKIDLEYTCPVDLLAPAPQAARELAALLLPKLELRLSSDQRETMEDRKQNPFAPMPDIENDYVFEFALQLQQMVSDVHRFFEDNAVDEANQNEIIVAMEAILRPAIVVDGQHRLFGAANIDADVYLPVVALPHCPWTEQVYQFVVINEKAQRVDQSLLTDIFGSSLTQVEQKQIRSRLERSNVEVESRIAAVIANRTPDSPFRNMVVVKMEGTAPSGVNPYISDRTIRVLIDGSNQKYSRGWRTDEDFYRYYVAPTITTRRSWDGWSGGAWQSYWFAFWETVKNFYNEESARLGKSALWNPSQISNLTKAVTLRQMQTLFIDMCVETMKRLEENREVLVDMLGDEEVADQKIAEQRRARALPQDLADFRMFVRTEFLQRGIPVKVFTAKWKSSLDDAQGQTDLWDTLSKAFFKSRKGERFHVRGQIFEAAEDDD